jgi:hypothetical protein
MAYIAAQRSSSNICDRAWQRKSSHPCFLKLKPIINNIATMLGFILYMIGWTKPKIQSPWLMKPKTLDNKINMKLINANPAYAKLLKLYPDAIEWAYLCLNQAPEAIELLEANQDKINWTKLSFNPSAIKLLEANLDKVNWKCLSRNPAAIEILKAHPDKIDWDYLSANPKAIKMLKANPDKIKWSAISANPGAYDIVADNLDKIDWHWLCENYSSWAVDILRFNRENIDWDILSMNPYAVRLFDNNPKKINWDLMSSNSRAEFLMWYEYKNRIHYGFACRNINPTESFMTIVRMCIQVYKASNDGNTDDFSMFEYDYSKIWMLKRPINRAIKLKHMTNME